MCLIGSYREWMSRSGVKEKKRGRERDFTDWFISQMVTMTGARAG